MSDTITPSRVEPIMETGPIVTPPPPAPTYEPAGAEPDRTVPVAPAVSSSHPETAEPMPVSSSADQLARLEDKTARIEEKLARSEAATQRVVDRFEAASHRMNEVAQQSELAAVRGDVKWISRRVRTLPGFGALVLTAVITAVITTALTILVLRYLPGTTVR